MTARQRIEIAHSRQLRWYRERKENGQCTICAQPAAKKKGKSQTLCPRCKEARKKQNRKAWAARKLKQAEPEFD